MHGRSLCDQHLQRVRGTRAPSPFPIHMLPLNFSSFTRVQDSLLASPLILDLVILAELLTRIQYREITASSNKATEFAPLYSVLSLLSYMLKAPLVKPGTDVVNALGRQRNALEMFMKACLGLEGQGDLLLESRIW